MMKIFLTSILVLGAFFLSGQDLNNYKPLKNQGNVPEDFYKSLEDRIEEQSDTYNDDNDSRKNRKAKETFYEQANYQYKNMLSSGRVMFGDPLTNYVRDIGKFLLQNEPELKDEIEFYVVKSQLINAFMTNDGNAYVTVGLLAQIETESQLALVLSHEVEHYKKKHIVNSVVHRHTVNKDRTIDEGGEKIIALTKYSKENEVEADQGGLFRLLAAGYKSKDLMGVFDVLEFGYLPLSDQPFDTTFFNTEYINFGGSFLDEIDEIEFVEEEEEDDLMKTHPNLDKRRLKLEEGLEFFEGHESVDFLKSKQYFEKMRACARFELVNIQIRDGNLAKAIYNSNYLLSLYPENKFLIKTINTALYYAVKQRAYIDVSRSWIRHTKVTGESQQVNYFLSNADLKKLCVATVHRNYEYYKKYRDEHSFKMFEDLVYELNINFDFELEDFSVKGPLASSVSNTKDEKDLSKLSKYEKLRLMKEKKNDQDSVVQDLTYSFVDLYKIKGFKSDFNDGFDRATSKHDFDVKKDSVAEEKKFIERDIEEFVILNPKVFRLNKSQKSTESSFNYEMKFTKSDRYTTQFADHIASVSAALNRVDISTYYPIDDRKSNDHFNDYVTLAVGMYHITKFSEADYFIPFNYDDLVDVRKRRQIRHFGTFDLMNVYTNNKADAFGVIFSTILYPTIPLYWMWVLSDKHENFTRINVIDLDQFSLVKYEENMVRGKFNKSLVKSIAYSEMLKLKKEKR